MIALGSSCAGGGKKRGKRGNGGFHFCARGFPLQRAQEESSKAEEYVSDTDRQGASVASQKDSKSRHAIIAGFFCFVFFEGGGVPYLPQPNPGNKKAFSLPSGEVLWPSCPKTNIAMRNHYRQRPFIVL